MGKIRRSRSTDVRPVDGRAAAWPMLTAIWAMAAMVAITVLPSCAPPPNHQPQPNQAASASQPARASGPTSGPASGPAAAQDRQWRDEIVYVVIPATFFDGDAANNVMARRFGPNRSQYEGGYWGGDLEGVIQKLDYLQGLGVTALLVYPVVANDAGPFGKYLAGGYRPTDYFSVDQNLGDMATFKRLIAGAHKRDMHVILDMPLGIPGVEHPYHPSNKQARPDWFGKMTIYGVPQWNVDNPQVADYFIKVSQFWKAAGCDGFRMDSAHLHSQQFWKRYVQEMKRGSPDFTIMAELPVSPRQIGQFLTATGLDSAYDFSSMTSLDVFAKGQSVKKLSFVFGEGRKYYPRPQDLCSEIDNYSNPAFITAAKEPKIPRAKLALTLLLTLDRVPLINGGQEVGVAVDRVGQIFEPASQASPLLPYTRQLTALRRSHEALRRGEFAELYSKDPVYAFARTYEDSTIAVILNNSGRPQDVSFTIGPRQWEDVALYDLLAGKAVKAARDDAPLKVEPWAAMVMTVGQ